MLNKFATTIIAKGGIREIEVNVFDTLITFNADLHLLLSLKPHHHHQGASFSQQSPKRLISNYRKK